MSTLSLPTSSSSPTPPTTSSSSSHPLLPRSSSSSHPPLPPSSSSAPRSSGSPTLTSPTGLSSSSLLNTEIVTDVQLAVLLAVYFFVPFCLLIEQRRRSRRYHPDPPNLREDDLYGQTPRYLPYFPEFKLFNFWGIIDVNIQTPPSCRFYLGNPPGAPPSPHVSMPHPATSQPLNIGVDPSSGLSASQQSLPTQPPVPVPHPPTSQPVLNSAVDSSSGFPASHQRLALPSPVSVPRPPTSQPVLNNGVDSSSVFSTSQYPSASPPKKITVEMSEATRDLYKGILPGNKNMLLKIGGSQGEREFQQPLPPPSPGISLGISKKFTYEELVLATDSFSETNLLGQGGFGGEEAQSWWEPGRA